MIGQIHPWGLHLGLSLCLLLPGCRPPPPRSGPFEVPKVGTTPADRPLTDRQRLGKLIFFDTNLSEPPGQSCAVCHTGEVGWTGPDLVINAGGAVYEGAVPGRFGNRKPPASAYAPYSPVLALTGREQGMFTGGNFWDGNATGERLGNPAADQAQGPFLNPLEQNNPSPAVVVAKVCSSTYAGLFIRIFGPICDDVDAAYDAIAVAITEFEASSEMSAFSSKYDSYLAKRAHLTPLEREGLDLFRGKAKCAACHPSDPGPEQELPLFTDFTFDNLGVPRNPANPFYNQPPEFNPLGAAWDDPGLGGFLASRADYAAYSRVNYGKMRVPTLRNVDKRPYPGFVKAYTHNGVFKSLKALVRFYNTRDVLPLCPPAGGGTIGEDCWPPPEVGLNQNMEEMGNLGLTEHEEDALVAFMQTLSDGYAP